MFVVSYNFDIQTNYFCGFVGRNEDVIIGRLVDCQFGSYKFMGFDLFVVYLCFLIVAKKILFH